MTIVNNEKNSITNNGYINPSLSSVTLNTEARSLPETAHLPEAGLEEVKGEESTPFPFKTDPSSFPDGGFQASLVVLGTFCCFFCSFGWIGCELLQLCRSFSLSQVPIQSYLPRYRRLPSVLSEPSTSTLSSR